LAHATSLISDVCCSGFDGKGNLDNEKMLER